jgi:hypothetical protein
MISDLDQTAGSSGEALPRPGRSRRRRTGKIARLSKDLRDIINLMLRDGATNNEIRDRLSFHKEELNDQNVLNWRTGGYLDWLNEQARLDDMKARREFAMEIVKTNEGSAVHEAGLQIAASQIYELLSDFDVDTLKEKLQGDPENYSRIVNAMAKLSDSGLKYERYHAEVQAAKSRIEAELGRARSKGGITAETLQTIETELKLL